MKNLKKQIGKLFVIGFHGLNPSDDVLSFVEEYGIGGVIFFARNIDDPRRLKSVVSTLEEASGQPLFTSIDQEGGLVTRILNVGSPFPGAMGLAATGDLQMTREMYRAIGLEMRALKLNWNLAPVLDINHRDNPSCGARAFGDTPEAVAKYALAAIQGLQETGVLACAKHFPGKGHARVDSHLTLPTIPYDRERLISTELFPFQKAIEAGVGAVMTSHVFFPAFEPTPNLPATLSKPVLTDLLRHQMKFQGLLITDDLEMGAITETFGVAEASRLSFLAGADQLLICHELSRQRQAAQALLDAVQKDPEAGRRLEESLGRVEKGRRQFLATSASELDLEQVASNHAPLVHRAYQASILCHRLMPNRLPLSPNSRKVFLCPEISALVQVEEHLKGNGIQTIIERVFPKARTILYNPKATAEEFQKLYEGCPEAKNPEVDCIALSYNAHLFPGQTEGFQELSRRSPRAILAALRNPYDVTSCSGFQNAFATFGFRSPAIECLFEVLLGKVPAKMQPWPVQV